MASQNANNINAPELNYSNHQHKSWSMYTWPKRKIKALLLLFLTFILSITSHSEPIPNHNLAIMRLHSKKPRNHLINKAMPTACSDNSSKKKKKLIKRLVSANAMAHGTAEHPRGNIIRLLDSNEASWNKIYY